MVIDNGDLHKLVLVWDTIWYSRNIVHKVESERPVKTLLLMRHAKSSWSDASLSDHERPLNSRGVNDAGKMGRLLADYGLIPGVIVSSSSKRTKETISYLLEKCPFSGEVVFRRELYHGGPDDILESLHKWGTGFDCVLVLGHNPGVEYALEEFTGESERVTAGALAQIEFDVESWDALDDDVEGSLVNFWRPRELT